MCRKNSALKLSCSNTNKGYVARLFILSLLLMLIGFAAKAQNITIDKINYSLNSTAHTASITTSKEAEGEIIIPEIIEHEGAEYTVTAINGYSFQDNLKITKITLPETIVSIGDCAFVRCSGLEYINFPSSLKSITAQAFLACTSLKEIILPDGFETLGAGAFNGCTSATKIVLPSSLASLPDNAFVSCSSVVSVEIPNSITSIGKAAFKNCTSLQNVSLPDCLESIGNEGFYKCAIQNINLPASLKSLGSSVFYNCESLTNISIPNGMESIPYAAFMGCKELSSITLPNTIKAVDSFAFANCVKLLTISLPNSIASIGASAFSGCSELQSIAIPYGVESLESGVFYKCDKLASIAIPNSVALIGDQTFFHCENLEIVELPNSLTKIGKQAFDSCYKLKSITIPEGVEEIGDNAFQVGRALTSVSLPNSLKSIGKEAFKSCGQLVTFRLSPNVTSIGDGCFTACSKLNSLIYITDTPVNFTSLQIPSTQAKLYANKAAQQKYEATSPWKNLTTEWCELTLDQTSLTFGESSRTQEIAATVPTEMPFSQFSVSWSSSVPNIASVVSEVGQDGSPKGVVTARNKGTCTIIATATTDEGDILTSTCEVTVSELGVGIKIDTIEKILNMPKETEIQLTAETKPENNTVTWSSSDEDVASVDGNNGLVTAKGIGRATITAKTTINGHEYSDHCEITVNQLIETLDLKIISSDGDESSVEELTLSPLGNVYLREVELVASLGPDNANNQNLTWNSSNNHIVTVSVDETTHKATLTCHEKGEATVTVATTDGSDKEFVLNVSVKRLVESITLANSAPTIYLGGKEDEVRTTITPTISPTDVSNPTLEWTSSDTKIATVTVNEAGAAIVEAVSPGTVTITAKSTDGTDKSASCTVTVEQLVTEVTLDSEVRLYFGGTDEQQVATLTATIAPENATDKSLTWTSSAPTVASVDENGNITALKVGTAIITAKANDKGAKSAVCNVVVEHLVENIAIQNEGEDVEKVQLTLGGGTDKAVTYLAAAVNPEATNKSVTWTSSDPEIVSINSDGMMMALKTGAVTITATANDISGLSATCEVEVCQLPIHIALYRKEMTLVIGDDDQSSATLIATIAPDDATDASVEWSSSDPEVATVDAEGKVSAIAEGEAIISATTVNGLTAECAVRVIVRPTDLTLSTYSATLRLGAAAEEAKLKLTVSVSNEYEDYPEYQTIIWSSSNPEVASVDNYGNVTAHKAGQATIFANTSYGLYTSCIVTVLQRPTAIALDRAAVTIECGASEDDTVVLTALLTPSGVDEEYMENTAVSWTSSDLGVVSVTDGRL